MKRTLALFLLTFVGGAVSAGAAVLHGRVVEVHDGRTVTVENTGRRIKVALKAADAPDRDQPYGDVARQHLAALVMGRHVSIEYTGLGPEAILIGKVFCDDRDVGLQMIRDGVAWFDRSYETNLNAQEGRLYAESERAARGERRGLWQDAKPTPPWEWRSARASRTDGRRQVTASAARGPAARSDASAGAKPGSAPPPARPAPPRAEAGDAQWPVFSPSNSPFSVRIPAAGLRYTKDVQKPDGGTLSADLYAVRHLKNGYLAVWTSGTYKDQGLDLSVMFDLTVEVLNKMFEAESLPCEFYQSKDAPLGGFVGRRYKLRGCYLKGALRHYYKVEGGKLTIILVGVVSEIPDDPEVGRFLDSFSINQRAGR